ncbi:hypothetical protein N7456_006004 [Penicillium angulare]|uniref:AAA+ ATPase domain-containing protein n=1 Tax=Penicillium angulare TaxID=116970 RepID=A0A9W9FZH7_9EURO|nr:hypothetical protein N7456_006004 [Penicillium angulare]
MESPHEQDVLFAGGFICGWDDDSNSPRTATTTGVSRRQARRNASCLHPPDTPDEMDSSASEASYSGDEADLTDTTEYAPVGSICDIHNLYQSKDRDGLWVKELPQDLPPPSETSESNQYALVARHKRCYDGRRNLKLHSIFVQSNHLKNFLAGVLEGYSGLTLTLNRVKFHEPFRPFVQRWERLLKARSEVADPEIKAHVDLLYRLLKEELGSTIAQKEDLLKNGVITYEFLDLIFEPGDLVFSNVEGHPRAFIFNSGEFENDSYSPKFYMSCQYIGLRGQKFSYMSTFLKIPWFEGTLAITSLPVFPFAYHKEQSTIKAALIARGALWETYKGYHYKQYDGPINVDYLYGAVELHLKGRIVIDAESYNTFTRAASTSGVGEVLFDELDDEKRMLATSTLLGYALKNKRWTTFQLDGVKDIVWDDRAFDSLVLPHSEHNMKRLILALTRSQSKGGVSFDDVITGKGRGMIFLLRGPPGVGKTLTAESVAEVMRVPLYVLSAADLGITASQLEDKMKRTLELIPRWGAVLLLDEADVFMEARDSTDLERNELVAIFLRLLEYYEGILFLTTNRAENIDPAFESRIHVSIRFPDLNHASRRQIWKQFIGQANMERFSDDQLERISEVNLNGRQIKNVIRTAHLLAHDEGSPLNFEYVETVLNLRVPGDGCL